jgi:hypothetical protein
MKPNNDNVHNPKDLLCCCEQCNNNWKLKRKKLWESLEGSFVSRISNSCPRCHAEFDFFTKDVCSCHDILCCCSDCNVKYDSEGRKRWQLLEEAFVSRISDVSHSEDEWLKQQDDLQKIVEKVFEESKKLLVELERLSVYERDKATRIGKLYFPERDEFEKFEVQYPWKD